MFTNPSLSIWVLSIGFVEPPTFSKLHRCV